MGMLVEPGKLWDYCRARGSLPLCYCGLAPNMKGRSSEGATINIGKAGEAKGGHHYFTCHLFHPFKEAGADDTEVTCGFHGELSALG